MLELIPYTEQIDYPLLTLLIAVPVLGAAILLFIRNAALARTVALAFSLVELALCAPLLMHFNPSIPHMQFGESYEWIKAWNIHYKLGVDGISVLFVALSALLTTISIMVSWKAITDRVREFMIALLFLEAGMIGVFMALDMFLFYIFWEAMLIPMYLLIGVWGGPNRLYAAVKFFLYTLVGSVLMLIGILAVYFYAGGTFDVLTLMNFKYSYTFQLWVFASFFLAFAVKVPMFPFHTWLPDAHVEAPTAGSIILAGILLKMGAYGFLRFSLPFFPDASIAWTPAIMILSVIAIIYGAYMAFAQTDFKKLIAYSSVSHMGFVTLGIFALNSQGVAGGLIQMINHGVSTGALFLLVGVIYERTHTRMIADYGGIAAKVPVYATILMIITLSSIGLPGTNGFVGEFAILLGAFKFQKVYAVIAALGVILGAGYMLWLYQRVAFGKITNPHNEALKDMNYREIAAVLPLVALVFYIGLYPNPTFTIMNASVENLIAHVHAKAQVVPAVAQAISTAVGN
ncbi:MAG TPA: NADH-quinone oxidoreductase subunit M [Nitrospiraceae bacterium]|nr:NADH-quinone oxidoreductase subunit M [Nitrospiraceae bacterium]HAS53928.1 NADH-quinone oxidoreductase subunit M [Nitrospiraceae bacterium]